MSVLKVVMLKDCTTRPLKTVIDETVNTVSTLETIHHWVLDRVP